MLDLPRSARLASWGTAAATGRVTVTDAVRAVTGHDEPHVVDDGGTGLGASDLTELLAGLRGADAGFRAVLPAPGDPTGLPGPTTFNVEALTATEAVLLTTGEVRLGLVPEVRHYGSVLEPGVLVQWAVLPVAAPRTPDGTTLADAERELRAALATAVAALGALDVARWREDAADRIAAVRDGGLSTRALAPGTDARIVRVAASAARVRAIVALAVEDDGAAISGFEADARARSLREVDAVARRAMAVAVNAGVVSAAGDGERAAGPEVTAPRRPLGRPGTDSPR